MDEPMTLCDTLIWFAAFLDSNGVDFSATPWESHEQSAAAFVAEWTEDQWRTSLAGLRAGG